MHSRVVRRSTATNMLVGIKAAPWYSAGAVLGLEIWTGIRGIVPVFFQRAAHAGPRTRATQDRRSKNGSAKKKIGKGRSVADKSVLFFS